ncbi:MAG: RagB/SusD family nutrient uptake outer membrane protein [Mucinivorans sp.]
MKKIINKSLIAMAMLALVGTSTSCSYLAVSDQLAKELTIKEVFDNSGFCKRWHANIYTGIPDMSHLDFNSSYSGLSGLSNPWPGLCDEMQAHNNVRWVTRDGYNSGNASFTRWMLYKQIRQAWLFLKNVHPIAEVGGQGDALDPATVEGMKGEAMYFIAYYHWLLFELYGPIPIMNEIADPTKTDLSFPRASVDECVAFIDKMFLDAAAKLNTVEATENRRTKPSKITCYAFRAKLHAFAASPLYNGGFPEAMALKNKDGKQLFPAANPAKWQTAKTAMEDYLTLSSSYHGIYRCGKVDGSTSFDAAESLYQVFQKYNTEIVWATSADSWGYGVGWEGHFLRVTPRGYSGAMPCYGILQDAVDDFRMANGKKIDDAGSGYDRANEFQLTDYTYEKLNRKASSNEFIQMTEKDIAKAYQGREPRFYQWVVYQGRSWQIDNEFIVSYIKGGNNDNSSGNNSQTGYIFRKWLPQNILQKGESPRMKFIPTIILRQAEMLLLAAEVFNEASKGTDPRTAQFVNDIRTRAGLPTLEETYPGKAWDYEALKKAVIEEKRIELMGEGQRYFDLRRWMLCEGTRVPFQNGGSTFQTAQAGPFNMMNMDGPIGDKAAYFKRVKVFDHIFPKSWYLYPIPLSEVQNSKGVLVQNPGW